MQQVLSALRGPAQEAIMLLDRKKLTFSSLMEHLAPIKPMTVPRLELTAAVLATRCSVMLEKEFKFSDSVKHFFYTDSTVVLGYISNSTRRYQVFAANRVGIIQS